MRARADALKDELVDHPAVREWSSTMWADIKASLLAHADDPDSDLRRRLVGAVAVGTSDGTGVGGGQIAQFVAQMTLMRYGREDELQSDSLGVRFMSDAGYDPRAMIDVMDILASASGGSPSSPRTGST